MQVWHTLKEAPTEQNINPTRYNQLRHHDQISLRLFDNIVTRPDIIFKIICTNEFE